MQKYLLEKTRICFQAKNERNYHVFYHLLVGSSAQEKQALHLLPPEAYRYLNQVIFGKRICDEFDGSA